MASTAPKPAAAPDFDVVVVGAGFSGMYMLLKLRELGLSAQVIEAGSDVGGTWYWNRYPGARVDIQSLEYSFGFDPQLEREWRWSERYAPQPELLRYAGHVADRYDLRRDIRFDTRVTTARFDESTDLWHVGLDDGSALLCRHVVLATGCLSVPTDVDFPGLTDYAGRVYRTSQWPHGGVDFTGQRVGIIGTGSSAIQTIPIVAEQAAKLTVFQRTPNYSMPAHNGPIPEADWQEWLADPRAYRARSRATAGGFWNEFDENRLVSQTPPAEIEAELERRWAWGGFRILSAFADTSIDPESNRIVHEFVARKIREQVQDPRVAELLTPRNHPFATKRPCVDTGYYRTFNRENVELVDLHAEPLARFTPTGIETATRTHEFDAVILATGFDAMTGAIARIDIRGRGGVTMSEHWAHGPQTLLGLMAAGFPNLFIITGPGSPSVLTNMIHSIEQHVEWVAACLAHLGRSQAATIEASPEAEAAWTTHVDMVAAMTLRPQANSWYMGANVPGKPRRFMPYAGGLDVYTEICDRVAAKGYDGFTIRGGGQVISAADGFSSLPEPKMPPEPLVPIIMERLAKFEAERAAVG